MRKEDKAFADIVKQEFDEHWTPPAPREPETGPEPPADFHLNLYDDDETYRQAPRAQVSAPMAWGVALLVLGIVIAIARFTPLHLPSWTGWVAIGCFVAGTSLSLWHLTHRKNTTDDDGEV